MRLSMHALRFAAAGATILGLVSASPAAAQSTVTLSVAKPPKTITPGGTADFDISVANSGPSTARGVTLTVTMPPEVTLSDATGVAAAGCGDVDKATNSVTCPLDDIADQATVDVVITVALALPKPLTCPNGATIGAFDATVAATGVTDGSTHPLVAAATVKQNDIADLGVALDGPSSTAPGETITFTTTIKNAGPCVATTAVATLGAGPGMVFQSGTGVCGSAQEGDDCPLGNLQPNATVTFSRTYKVDNVPANLMHTGVPNEVDVSSKTADPNGDNDSATTLSTMNIAGNTGCASAGGTAGLAGVAAMLLVALALRRRA